jgi:hypothetical protein
MPDKQHLFSITSWLLKAATLLTIFIIAVLSLAFVAVTLGLGGLLFVPALIQQLDIPLVADGIPMARAFTALLFAVAGGLISVILILFVIRATSGIVETAIAGDPFVGGNAARLNRIGLLLLGIMAVQFLTLIAVTTIAPESVNNPHFQINAGSDPDPVGMLGILLIFVLARIFRHGSEMRDELEGMV